MVITSRENEHIKQYVKLCSNKKHRDAAGLFCLEGMRLVTDAAKSGVALEKIFITEKCLQKYNCELAQLCVNHGTIIPISDSISDKISDVKTPQGVFAIAKKLDKNLDADKIKESGRYVALCSVQDPGNIGTIIRTAEALGIDGVLLYQTCDIYSPKVVRSTMGSLFRMNFALCDDIVSLTHQLNQQGVQTLATVIDTNAVSLTECAFQPTSVLYIGNEGNGLSDELVSACTDKVTIHMGGNTESLNAAVAATIAMWEMTKKR